jgi:hypothetical protein
MDLAIKRNKNDQTRLLVTIPYSQRVGLHQLSARLGLSQQSLIRSSIAALLSQHEDPEPQPKTRKTRAKASAKTAKTAKGGAK